MEELAQKIIAAIKESFKNINIVVEKHSNKIPSEIKTRFQMTGIDMISKDNKDFDIPEAENKLFFMLGYLYAKGIIDDIPNNIIPPIEEMTPEWD